MGYYSEVGLALTLNGKNLLDKRISEMEPNSHIKEELNRLFTSADHHYTEEQSGAEVWHWKLLKWYAYDPEYYPEIDFLDTFLDGLDVEYFYFIRVGEDYDDTEVRGEFTENPFDLELARGITIQAATIQG